MASETGPEHQSDTAIACQLVRAGYILRAHYEVWERSRRGETIYSMRRDYPNEARGAFHAAMTLYRWAQGVDAAIAAARVVEAPAVTARSPWGISVADGHSVRRAADTTPPLALGPVERRGLRSQFPDAERLRASGKRPR